MTIETLIYVTYVAMCGSLIGIIGAQAMRFYRKQRNDAAKER